jgi:hypothetical protein
VTTISAFQPAVGFSDQHAPGQRDRQNIAYIFFSPASRMPTAAAWSD